MRNLIRITSILFLALGLVSVNQAQDKSTRAEFECLMMANSSAVVAHGDPARHASYHHVWMPDLRYGSFESNGVNFTYEMEGRGDETVIVVHGGAGLPHEYFHPMLSNLGRYAKMVYFDRRADMRSTKSVYDMASLDEMAEDVDALRQSLGLKRVTLLGHSFGGAIALTYALRYPDHVKRLILVSTAATIENPAEAEKRLVKKLTAKEMAAYSSNEGDSGVSSVCQRVLKRYRALFPHYFHKEHSARFLDGGVYSAYFDALAKKMVLASKQGSFDVRAALGQIKAPVLVFAGRHDVVTPVSQTAELAEGLPRSRAVVMEHSAHFPFVEESYLFTEWVRQFMAATNDMVNDKMGTGAVTGSDGSH
ncbi:MAG TPA: alpha/beta hydrolase [Blastocatellia bacterium]|nr:alpha/beta hydrolase [Blastocatellia bacterium]